MFHLELSGVNLVVEKVKVNKFRRSLKGYTNLDAYTIRIQSDCCFEKIFSAVLPLQWSIWPLCLACPRTSFVTVAEKPPQNFKRYG